MIDDVVALLNSKAFSIDLKKTPKENIVPVMAAQIMKAAITTTQP